MTLQGNVKNEINEQLRALQTTDSAHPNTFNPLFQDLLDNDVTLDKKINDNLTQLQQIINEYLAEYLRIEIGVAPPENPNSKTFWLEDLGESIDFVLGGSGLIIANASLDGSNNVWFDENI